MRRTIRVAAVCVVVAGALAGCSGSESPDRTQPRTAGIGTPTASSRPVAGSAGAGDRYFPGYGNGGYDVQRYRLTLEYDPSTDVLRGTVTITAATRTTAALRRFNLDLIGMTVRALSVDGEPADWRRSGQELVVTPRRPLEAGGQFEVVVRYDGVPRGGFRRTDDGALVAGQPESAAYWFPVNDHPIDKATYSFDITVPRGLVAVANGRLDSHTSSGSRERWRWSSASPMASYLATVAIGDFDLRAYTTGSGLRMWDAVDRDLGGQADRALDRQGEIIDFLASRFGRYPFEAGGAIVDQHRLGFALETQTRPVYPSGFFNFGEPGEEIILVHEIAHQWFGDSVSVARWRDIVLNEGFATYAEWLWMEKAGYATVQQAFDFFYAGIGRGDPFWSVPVGNPGAERLFDVAVYWRGAMALHQLRLTVGDDDFWAIVRAWAARKADRNATVPEFVELAGEISGEDVSALARRWLDRPGRPATIEPEISSGPLTALGRQILAQRSHGYIG